MLKKVLLICSLSVIVLLAGIMLFSKKNLEETYTINTSKTTVIKQIRSLQRLETASFTIEKIIDAGTDGNKFQQILFGDRVLLIAHGEVIAGFDFSQIEEDDIRIQDQTIHMTLPAPEILVVRLDNEQTRVYDRQRGLLTKGDSNLESQARRAAEQVIREAACEGNILADARDNGKKQLTALLKALQFSSVEILVAEGTC